MPAAGGRLGIYFPTPGDFDEARAAYLADWLREHRYDTFTGWLAGVLSRHAGLTPRGRARLAARTAAPRPTGAGVVRSFPVPEEVYGQVRAAIEADQHAGRWLTDSSWALEAVAAAVGRARRHGPLPAPPARLPRRLSSP